MEKQRNSLPKRFSSLVSLLATTFDLTHATPVPPLPTGFFEEFLRPMLSQTGFAGILLVLGFYLVGRRLLGLEQAVREFIEAKLLGIAAHQHISAEVKANAAKMLERNTAAKKKLPTTP